MGSVAATGSVRTTSSSCVGSCPLSPAIDQALNRMLERIQELYHQGKRNFAILTHSSPDPDAVAGSLGMKHLLQLVLPGDAQVRIFVSGSVGDTYARNGRFAAQPIEEIKYLYDTAQSAGKSALVLVDQPTIRSERVLPSSLLGDETLHVPREADVILDHHNGEGSDCSGIIRAKEAGSTSALIWRALHLATEREALQPLQCRWYRDQNLAMFVNVGAWTDAGVALSTWGAPPELPAIVKWIHDETKGRFDESQVKDFDLSASFDEFRQCARKTRTECGPLAIDGKVCKVVLAFVGVIDDPNKLGAFASEYLHEEVRRAEQGIPTGVAVFGVLRSSASPDIDPTRASSSERVQVSIRTCGGVCSDEIAKLISEQSGGEDARAGATLQVPLGLHAQHSDTFAGCCLCYLQAKLQGGSPDWQHAPRLAP